MPLRRRIAAVSSADYKILEHVKTRAFIILLFSSFFSAFSYFIPYAHLVTYSIDVGIDDVCFIFVSLLFILYLSNETNLVKNLAALVLSFMGVASIFGRIIIGYLSDKLDRKNIYNFCLFMMAGSCYLWYFSTHIISIIAFGFFYSFFAGNYSYYNRLYYYYMDQPNINIIKRINRINKVAVNGGLFWSRIVG